MSDRKFECGMCGKQYKSEFYYKRHVSTCTSIPVNNKKEVCGFCNKKVPASLIMKHTCRQKIRYGLKDTKSARLALDVWVTFRKITKIGISSKRPVLESFINAHEYTQFIKFAEFLLQVKPLNHVLFYTTLISREIPISDWTKRETSDDWVIAILGSEAPDVGIYRTMSCIMKWAENTGFNWYEFFDKVTYDRVHMMLSSGELSPWYFYISDDVDAFISKCSDDELEIISKFVNPSIWRPKLKEYSSTLDELKELVNGKV